ncbi:MAG: rhomboid family intramembrane serine protease [Candidatus Acetothermia bacterium]
MIPIRDRQPSYRFSAVTVTLIAICAVVFLFQLTLSPEPDRVLDLTKWKEYGVLPLDYPKLAESGVSGVRISPKRNFFLQYGAVPGEIANMADFPPLVPFPVFFTLITSMFIHGGFFHLIGNMLFLWIFGDNVEDAMGHVRFALFYFLSGIAGGLLQIVANSGSGTPMVGASGAIAGVMAAYLILYPHSRIVTVLPIFFFFTFVEIPAALMVGLWFLFELVRAVGEPAGQVARLAHVGGFIAGAMMTPYLKSKYVRMRLFDYFK